MTPMASKDNLLGDGDKSWIELQNIMPHPATNVSPDTSIVNAARVSYLGDSKGPEKDKKLLFYLLSHRHTSPFEQVEFQWRVRAPVIVWWQWVRHRTWHYNFQSGRYTPFKKDDFYIPTEWRRQSESNKQASEGVIEKGEGYTRKLAELATNSFALYEAALEDGVAREQARLFLPAWSAYYIAICKVDCWNLLHFLRLRMAENTQWEIRQYAHAMYEVLRELMPWTAEAFSTYMLKGDL
jgi:thymidylate synthase (FAD)